VRLYVFGQVLTEDIKRCASALSKMHEVVTQEPSENPAERKALSPLDSRAAFCFNVRFESCSLSQTWLCPLCFIIINLNCPSFRLNSASRINYASYRAYV